VPTDERQSLVTEAYLARNREFESSSLQRGVCCKPDPLDQGGELQLAGTAQRAADNGDGCRARQLAEGRRRPVRRGANRR